MTITVYRIEVTLKVDNRYAIGRTEDWVVKKDKEFQQLNDAKEYIVAKSRQFTDLPIYICNAVNKKQMIEDFCFSGKYYEQNRFFLGPPDMDLIRRKLENAGIQVV